MERHGAAHRIKASKTPDYSAHLQTTKTTGMYDAPEGRPAIDIHFAGGQWQRNSTGSALSADEVEQLGLDPSLRTM